MSQTSLSVKEKLEFRFITDFRPVGLIFTMLRSYKGTVGVVFEVLWLPNDDFCKESYKKFSKNTAHDALEATLLVDIIENLL